MATLDRSGQLGTATNGGQLDGESLEVDFACELCGKPAAGFELLPAGVPRKRDHDHPARDVGQRHLHVWNFGRSGDSEVDPIKYAGLRIALEARDWRALYKLNWRYAVPWCRECDRCYCIDHWKIEYSADDPMCSEWGTCPKGHGKVLDD